MTYEEFIEWAGEDVRAEWVNGKVIELTPPTERHQEFSLWLASVLYMFVKRRRLGKVLTAPFEMKLDAIPSSRLPDILVTLTESAGRLDGERLNGVADLAIELISDESVTRDRRDKFAEYARAGVSEYWIIDPRVGRFSFQGFTLADDDYYVEIAPDDAGNLHSVVVTDFIFDPAWIGQDPLPDPDDVCRALGAATSDRGNR
jgi:Uma2 family endonuclease